MIDLPTGPPRVVASGLRFPEGPTVLDDGSVLVVEIERGTLTRIDPDDGSAEVVADCGGGPNGAAVGPDGRIWITNNGGCFRFHDLGGLLVPGGVPDGWEGGSIQAVDLDTGAVETVATHCGGRALRAPNDLVADAHGGMWFTDHGVRGERTADRTGVHYIDAEGTVHEAIHPLDSPNGIGLSPSGNRIYVAETHTGRVFAWDVVAPGAVRGRGLLPPHGELLAGLPGLQLLDSLAVDSLGNVCVGTLNDGGITVIPPDGSTVGHVALDDPLVTNIAFGGSELRTAYVTASGTGRLLALEWPVPGLELAHRR